MMKQTKRALMISLLSLLCVAVLAAGTYAAYTTHDSVKRVVSTQANQTELRFSSNYLSPCSSTTGSDGYAQRIISVGSSAEVSFGVTVCNYPQDDLSQVNEASITYTLSASLVDQNGASISVDGVTVNGTALSRSFNDTLPGGQATQHLYVVRIPASAISALSNAYLQLVAAPTDGTATGGMQLAGRLKIVPSAGQAAGWTGRFTDSLSDPTQLDAFNYEISGSAQGTVTLTWDSTKVTLGQWSQALLGVGNTSPVSFSVGGADQPTSYRLQFYRVDGIPEGETEADVMKYVACSFAAG